MALSSIDMNRLMYLEIERRELKFMSSRTNEICHLNDNEITVVEKWLENKITELKNKKEE